MIGLSKRARYIFVYGLMIVVMAALSVSVPGQEGQSGTTEWSPNVSPLPSPTGMVNDYAGVLDEASKQQLETRLRDFKNKTNPPVELAVAIVRTTGDRPIFDYSLAVARGWGIGAKQDDNPSALLMVAIDDRNYFTQISRDLEDELPDGLAGSLQRQYLVPEFRRGNYAKGISDTMDAYIRTIEARSSGGTAPPPAGTAEPRERGVSGMSGLFTAFCCLAVILVIGVIILSNRGGGSKRGGGGWRGGGFGGSGGALPWIIGSMIANAADSSSSSGGSSWGGSDWGGGGSDWGGFGGGGDFGGGGAGGDW